ncbi:MAG: hypothetical protein LAN71_17625, partial [Acidobacteriia bacterium]|nr:hypothetical protein [Terriglobia bacterium]
MAPVNIAKLLLTAQSLNLADLQDLQKSGISLEVAKAAGIVSVPPDAVPKILGACNYGWAAPRVESLMAFPYRPLNGDGEVNYWRFKVTPAIETREGTTKYLQPEGSLNHVYCPPGVDPQGKDTL